MEDFLRSGTNIVHFQTTQNAPSAFVRHGKITFYKTMITKNIFLFSTIITTQIE